MTKTSPDPEDASGYTMAALDGGGNGQWKIADYLQHIR